MSRLFLTEFMNSVLEECFTNISGQDSYHTHGEQVSLMVTKLLLNYLLALTKGLQFFKGFCARKTADFHVQWCDSQPF
jgi:hypothetical protein